MENQLEVILKECSLTGLKADYIVKNFETCFALAAEWDAKAKTIVVTDCSQKADMELAREGRLLLREKRIAIEKSRVGMKADILKEGRAIDAVAGKLKDLIIPIEEYLDKQEHFVELRQREADDKKRAEIERRMAEEEAAKVRVAEEELEKSRVENERLKKEAAKKEKVLLAERKKRDAQLEAERANAAEERRKQDAILAKERAKADAERKQAEDAKRLVEQKAEEAKRKAAEVSRRKLEVERKEKERLEAELAAQIECPKCHHKFNPERK